ncbi:hypothetical protein HDU83_000458 [Entophlyctis luteolus]|nr:hypothetical protein HDU83_000458 [Entophlyctis luteolus]
MRGDSGKTDRAAAIKPRAPELIPDADPASEAHLFLQLEDDDEEEEPDEDDDDDDVATDLANLTKRFPFICAHIERLLSTDARAVTVRWTKALFDFAKDANADAEMDLTQGEQLLLVTPSTPATAASPTVASPNTAATANRPMDRFAAIEESPLSPTLPKDVVEGTAVKTASILKSQPGSRELCEHLGEFLRMQSKYGAGWVVGLKVSIRDVGGGSASPSQSRQQRVVYRFVLRLQDIGLVPHSYVG